jgi:hypothetical protein
MGPARDPDLYWHIATGRWILAHGELPVVDYWNAFGKGRPWLPYSWSHEVVYALADSYFGLDGLFWLQGALAVFLIITVGALLGALAADYFFGLLVALFFAFGIADHFALRPQTVTWIYFLLCIFVLEKVKRDGLKTWHLLVVFSTFSLWSNSHITQILGILPIILFGVFSQSSEKDNILLLLSALVGSVVTPFFGAEWIIFLSKSGHPLIHSSIIEFGPATIRQYGSAVTILLIFVSIIFLTELKKKDPLKLDYLSLNALIFTLVGFYIVKFLPFAIVSLAAWLMVMYREVNLRGDKFNLLEGILKLKRGVNFLVGNGLGVTLLALIFLSIRTNYLERDKDVRYPKEIAEILGDRLYSAKILNQFGDGGFLMRLFTTKNGDVKNFVSIDGRTNVNPPIVMSAYIKALNGYPDWQDYLEIFNPDVIIWRNSNPLIAILENGTKWQVLKRVGSKKEGYSVFIPKS